MYRNIVQLSRPLPLLLAALLLGACAKPPEAAAPPAIPVAIANVESGTIEEGTEFVVTLESRNIANIRPRVDGNIAQVFVQLGDRVEAGEPLFEIDPSRQEAALESRLAAIGSARANLDNAQATLQSYLADRQRIAAELELNSERSDLEDAKATVRSERADRQRRLAILEYNTLEKQRYNQLAEEGAVSKERSDQADREYRQAVADLENQDETIGAAEARVTSAQRDLERRIATVEAQLDSQDELINAQRANVASWQQQLQQAQANATEQQVELEFYEILAPFSGIVGSVPVKVGDYADSETLLTTVSQSQPLEVFVQIPVERVSQVRLGTTIELLDQSGQAIDRVPVSFISPQADANTQTIEIKAIYDNDRNQLRTDQLIRGRVIWEEKPGLTVPFTAVKQIGGQNFVFVVEEQPESGMLIASQKPVQLGGLQGNNYQVISGVEENQTIVVSGVIKLRDGAPIADISQLGSPAPEES